LCLDIVWVEYIMEPSLCISSGRKGRCQFLHYYVPSLEYKTTPSCPWNMKLLRPVPGIWNYSVPSLEYETTTSRPWNIKQLRPVPGIWNYSVPSLEYETTTSCPWNMKLLRPVLGIWNYSVPSLEYETTTSCPWNMKQLRPVPGIWNYSVPSLEYETTEKWGWQCTVESVHLIGYQMYSIYCAIFLLIYSYRIGLQRRLYGIYTVCFLIFINPCNFQLRVSSSIF